MSKIKVLIVDDSGPIRTMLSQILCADPDIEVAGSARDATMALDLLARTPPDVVTLDVEMPDVSGLELLSRIRKLAPKLPVIMFSSLTQRAASTTLDALALGATDYVTKPASTGSREASYEQVRTQLVPKIKALGRSAASSQTAHAPVATIPATPRKDRIGRSGPIELVAIGCSTGGPNALATVFADIPATLSAPFVIVQHMPPLFTEMLASRLSATCRLPFREATHGEILHPGGGWIAPGGRHMQVVREGTNLKVVLNDGPPENSCRPAVDVLFRSVATACGARTLAVVLTGMGQDGLLGCEQLDKSGAQIIVQDEATSVVWGMPGHVARAGLAQKVLPLAHIGADIVRRAQHQSQSAATSVGEPLRAGL